MKYSWQLLLLFVLAYYLFIIPYILPGEIGFDQLHKCKYSESTCTFPFTLIQPLLSILEETSLIFLIRSFLILLFFLSNKELSTSICNKFGKDSGICYIILLSLQFCPNINSARINKQNFEFILGTLFTNYYIRQSYFRSFCVFSAFIVFKLSDFSQVEPSDFYVFQEIHSFVLFAAFLSFSGKIGIDLRLLELQMIYPAFLVALPVFFSSCFLVPFFTMISAWGLNKM